MKIEGYTSVPNEQAHQRELNKRDDQVTEQDLSDLPNSQWLIPKHMHLVHDLFDGWLLEPEGVVRSGEGVTMIQVCKDCMDELRDSRTEKPPRFSLANNLWIGPFSNCIQKILTVNLTNQDFNAICGEMSVLMILMQKVLPQWCKGII